MKSYQSINDLELESIEHAVLLQSISNAKNTRVLKVCIPKIMSIGSKSSNDSNIIINKRMVLNDSSCFPKIPDKVYTCNYITVPLVDTAFRGPYREDKYGRIKLNAGEKITCIIPNNNILEIKATDWQV